MKKPALLSLVVATAMNVLLTTSSVLANGYMEIEGFIPIGPGNEVVNMLGQNGAMMHPDDLLFNKRLCPDAGLHEDPLLNPVLAPDGHQVTWGEYRQAQGTASLRCGPKGTHVVIHLSGLIPKGVYTMWVFSYDSADLLRPGAGAMSIGAGSLGAPDGSTSGFTASASGQGTIAVHHPAGAFSDEGEVGPCFFDEAAFQLVLAYHLDGQSYGPVPAPIAPPVGGCYWLPHLAFVFHP